jgi:hypothetical protein
MNLAQCEMWMLAVNLVGTPTIAQPFRRDERDLHAVSAIIA